MKRTVFASFAAMLILSTAFTAQAAHTHEYTKQSSKVYVCECGKEKTLYSLKGERVITLNCNGGSLYGGICKTDITEMITEQNKIKLPLPYKNSDYQFEGWFTEKRRKGIVRYRVLFRHNTLCPLELDGNTHTHFCHRGRLIYRACHKTAWHCNIACGVYSDKIRL